METALEIVREDRRRAGFGSGPVPGQSPPERAAGEGEADRAVKPR
jgi:hypothetical protein